MQLPDLVTANKYVDKNYNKSWPHANNNNKNKSGPDTKKSTTKTKTIKKLLFFLNRKMN